MRKTMVIFGLAAGLLAGCGGGSTKTEAPPSPTAAATTDAPTIQPSPTAAALPDPCSLLTGPQAQALAGTKLNPPVEAGAVGMRTLCQRTGPTTGPTAQVEIIVGDGAKKTLDIETGVLHHTVATLTGIGDEAHQEDGYVFVRVGSLWAEINLVLLDEDLPTQRKHMVVAAKEMAAAM